MDEVQIVFTAGGFFGHLAHVFGLTWSHVALRFREGEGQWRIIEASAHGVVERDWDSFIAESFSHKCYTIPTLTGDMAKFLIAYTRSLVGLEYDYWGFVKVIWRELRNRWLMTAFIARSYICSGLVYSVFLYIGLDLAPGYSDLIVLPDVLVKSPLLREV